MGRARRIAVTALAAALLLAPAVPVAAQEGFESQVSRISDQLKRRMTGKSWHKGCPVPIRRLRLIELSYHDFHGDRQTGRLVAHRDATAALVGAFRSMYRHGFRIRKMWLVDRYDANDRRSMRADNTSAFNCRTVAGTDRWSEHAYGRAIDINPVENPYVASDGTVSPRKGAEYADRSPRRRGMIASGGATVKAFERAGWGWGGYWSSAKDYQHFSASGS